MSEVPKIIDLVHVIEPHLNGAQLVTYTSKYLTKPGDNYGSVMLLISATLKHKNGTNEERSLIAKLPPVTNDLYWQIFAPERTCISENAVYQYLAPELEKLQREAGIAENELFDGFPKYYGSRISLNSNATKVDRDAVLVQENVQISGYRSGERHKPYDLAHTLLILKYIAKYHALPIALRIRKPEIYEKFVRPYFGKFNMNATIGKEAKDVLYEDVFKDLQALPNISEKEFERFKACFELYDQFTEALDADVKETPYNSLVHSDLWINNIMIKYAVDGSPIKLKLVDFQLAQYESIVHDIIFLLLSSVDVEVLEQNYTKFLSSYYEAFIACLESLNIDTSIYSWESFLVEVKRVAHIQIAHAAFMTKVIMAESTTLPDDFKDMNLTVLANNTGNVCIIKKLGEILRLTQKFDIFY